MKDPDHDHSRGRSCCSCLSSCLERLCANERVTASVLVLGLHAGVVITVLQHNRRLLHDVWTILEWAPWVFLTVFFYLSASARDPGFLVMRTNVGAPGSVMVDDLEMGTISRRSDGTTRSTTNAGFVSLPGEDAGDQPGATSRGMMIHDALGDHDRHEEQERDHLHGGTSSSRAGDPGPVNFAVDVFDFDASAAGPTPALVMPSSLSVYGRGSAHQSNCPTATTNRTGHHQSSNSGAAPAGASSGLSTMSGTLSAAVGAAAVAAVGATAAVGAVAVVMSSAVGGGVAEYTAVDLQDQSPRRGSVCAGDADESVSRSVSVHAGDEDSCSGGGIGQKGGPRGVDTSPCPTVEEDNGRSPTVNDAMISDVLGGHEHQRGRGERQHNNLLNIDISSSSSSSSYESSSKSGGGPASSIPGGSVSLPPSSLSIPTTAGTPTSPRSAGPSRSSSDGQDHLEVVVGGEAASVATQESVEGMRTSWSCFGSSGRGARREESEDSQRGRSSWCGGRSSSSSREEPFGRGSSLKFGTTDKRQLQHPHSSHNNPNSVSPFSENCSPSRVYLTTDQHDASDDGTHQNNLNRAKIRSKPSSAERNEDRESSPDKRFFGKKLDEFEDVDLDVVDPGVRPGGDLLHGGDSRGLHSSPDHPAIKPASTSSDIKASTRSSSRNKKLSKEELFAPTVRLPSGESLRLRYCYHCDLYQPLRTKHCRDCETCVRTHDHHCPWIGTCVGEFNRRYFVGFLFFQLIELGKFFIYGLAGLRVESISLFLLIAMTVIGVFIIMVGCLLSFHLYLVLANLTTWECSSWKRITYLKHIPIEAGSPFSKGIMLNICAYFCPERCAAKLRQKNMLESVGTEQGGRSAVVWSLGRRTNSVFVGKIVPVVVVVLDFVSR